MTDIEQMTGWTIETVKHYVTDGRRARREGKITSKHMPPEHSQVRRTLEKSDGKPLVVYTPVWRDDVIRNWLRERGVTVREMVVADGD
jgi:hypothetical protein